MSYTQEEYQHHVKSVWRVTGILAIVTIVEVGVALLFDNFLAGKGYGMGLNIFMIVASLLKAVYIVNVFMHIKYETLAMRLTILCPLIFFAWFIIAFLMEGQAWHLARFY